MSEQINRTDLTQGSILSKLLHIAVPIMGTQLVQMTYNLTDMFWLGKVSSDAVAASGSAGMYLWLSAAFLILGRTGAEIGVAHNLGRGDKESARHFAQNALLLSVILGVAYGAAMIVFRTPLIGFFNIREANVAADAATYLAIAGIAMPMTFISAAIVGAFNGSGNSKTPFLINTVGLVVNMILDPYFIITLDMGISGAAIATAIGQTVVCILFLLAAKFYKRRPFLQFQFFAKPQREVLEQILRWSIPVGMESLLFTFLTMIISRFVAAFGANAIAVQRVGSQIESLSWMLGIGFSNAITAFVGQNYGAGKWSRIHSGFRISLGTVVGWTALVTLLLVTLHQVLIGLFLPGADTIVAGGTYLRILAVCQIPSALEYAASGALRGMGKTLPPSIVSITCNFLRVPLAYFLSTTSLGLNGIWWGITAGATVRGAWLFTWYLISVRKMPKEDQPIHSA